MEKIKQLIDKLKNEHSLSLSEYESLLNGRTAEIQEYIAKEAEKVRISVYGRDVFIRGLIEISNRCKNNCFYCGIRKDNKNCDRYILLKEDIINCAKEGYNLGFRTFVLQGGEGVYKVNDICDTVKEIKEHFPNCAVTLSLGEMLKEDYIKLYEAGADRYLLRHETADEEHYKKLHPKELSFKNRMECLKNLKEIGYQVGCGFMVGSPYQTNKTLAKDLKFIENFSPDMCGIGPFIPQKDTPFKNFPAGDVNTTLYLLSVIRLIKPNILLPATTALGTIDEFGREKGILAGANVVMPNLSPVTVRKKYALYDNKICTGDESAQCRTCLEKRISKIGYRISVSKGDIKKQF